MANEKITMLKLKRMFQLMLAGRSMNKICDELHMSKTTVKKYKDLAEGSGIPLEELRHMENSKLESLLQDESPVPQPDERKVMLDKLMDKYVRELGKPYQTVWNVWGMYISECPDGYQYTQFKKYVNEYMKSKRYAYTNTYEPGREMQVDYAGDPLYIVDKETGEYIRLSVLCCVMPYSNKSFAIAALDASQENLFYGLSKCMTYIGRVPRVIKSDNMAQWVKHGDALHESSFTEALDRWCEYYDVLPDNTRVRAPKDKGPAENTVKQFYIHVYTKMRDEVYYDLQSFNKRLLEVVDEYNEAMQKRYGVSRNEMFMKEEYPLMKDLPAEEYIFMYMKEVEVPSHYHVIIGKEQHRYSVPYKYIGKTVNVLWNVESVEVYFKHDRIAVHERDMSQGKSTTEYDHMPPAHKAMEDRRNTTMADYLRKALTIGPESKWALSILLGESSEMTDHKHRLCRSFFKYGEKYGEVRLESVCSYIHSVTETFTLDLLKATLDKGDTLSMPITSTPNNTDVRGASSYSTVS